MRQTRSVVLQARVKASERKTLQDSLSPAIREERLQITKDIAQEIVTTQETLGGRKHGSRKKIIGKYTNIYPWIRKANIDWHVMVLKKKKSCNNVEFNLNNTIFRSKFIS